MTEIDHTLDRLIHHYTTGQDIEEQRQRLFVQVVILSLILWTLSAVCLGTWCAILLENL